MYRLTPLLLGASLLVWSEQPETILKRAVDAHRSGDIDAAIQAYQEYLNVRPRDPEARSNLGAVLVRQGRFEEAIAEYQRALEVSPDSLGIALNLALAFYKEGDIGSAAHELELLHRSQSDTTQVTLLLADCWLQLGQNQKVIDLLTPLEAGHEQALAIDYMLGMALLREKQLVRGQRLLDKILRKGESAEGRLMMGIAKMGAGDQQAALENLRRAVELNPKLPCVNSWYGQALMATGNTAAAGAFRAELEINPNDFDSNLNLAFLLKTDQEYDQALRYLDRALRVRPGEIRARYQVATIQISQGKTGEARALLESVLQEAPNFTEAHVSLATVYYRLKRKADGDREREIVRKLNAAAQARQPGVNLEPGVDALKKIP